MTSRFRTIQEQAELVRSREVSARELVEDALDAIERLNPELNAFVTVCPDRALEAAARIGRGDERPLAGVPVAIKDSVALTEGVRTTQGSAALGEWVPDQDSAVVRRLRGAGAIVVGKTNTPEFALQPVTEPERFGPTRNPWDTSRTPGGSSGGSAAAVASGMVALGHGGDVGGSLRIPASCCGVVGLRPSRGRVSLAPYAEIIGGLFTEGAITRTVADTALVLDVLAGYETGDPYWLPPPEIPFSEAIQEPPGPMRVGVTTTPPNGVDVHPHCVEAVQEAARLLESLGHRVEEAAPDWSDPGYPKHWVTFWAGFVQHQVALWGRLRGEELDRDQLEPYTRQWLGEPVPTADYLEALEGLRRRGRRIVAFWDDHDVLLTPTLTQPPLEIGTLDKPSRWIPFMTFFNVTGQPAVSLPLHHADGLPIGVQLVGPPAGDAPLLALAAQLEEAAPWAQRRPPVSVDGGG